MPLLVLASTIFPKSLPAPAAPGLLFGVFSIWAHTDIARILVNNSTSTGFITQL
jgi:hypothetical protein